MFCFCKNVRTLKSVFLQSLSNVLLHPTHSGFLLLLLLRPFSSAWLPLASTSSPRSLLFCKRRSRGLDNGVPIKVILDVISWHAMYLEVSGRYHVLLVHLCMVSCHCGSCAAHGGHVGVSWRTHHGHTLSGVHVEISCVEVLAGFVGVHGAMTNRRLHCPLWLDYTGAGKKLIDGRAKVGDLGGLQGPVVQLRLSHTLPQSLER